MLIKFEHIIVDTNNININTDEEQCIIEGENMTCFCIIIKNSVDSKTFRYLSELERNQHFNDIIQTLKDKNLLIEV